MEKKNYKEIFKFDFKSESELESFVKNHSWTNAKGMPYEDTLECYISEIKKIWKILSEKRNQITRLYIDFNEEGIGINENDYKEVVNGLNEIIDKFTYHWRLFDKYLAEKQNSCNHEWEETCHDSHYTYYTCPFCGKEEKG